MQRSFNFVWCYFISCLLKGIWIFLVDWAFGGFGLCRTGLLPFQWRAVPGGCLEIGSVDAVHRINKWWVGSAVLAAAWLLGLSLPWAVGLVWHWPWMVSILSDLGAFSQSWTIFPFFSYFLSNFFLYNFVVCNLLNCKCHWHWDQMTLCLFSMPVAH